jgi:hypothetical protein
MPFPVPFPPRFMWVANGSVVGFIQNDIVHEVGIATDMDSIPPPVMAYDPVSANDTVGTVADWVTEPLIVAGLEPIASGAVEPEIESIFHRTVGVADSGMIGWDTVRVAEPVYVWTLLDVIDGCRETVDVPV